MNKVDIHESSYVDAGAIIGEGTKIWHFCHIMPKAKIGRNCSIGQNVFIADNVVVGDNVKIQNNVSLYEGVVLEDHTFCGPSVVFTNVKTPRASFPRNTSADYLTTIVRQHASIGANATIVCGVEIASYSLIGAGSVVTKDVPMHAIVVGSPAKIYGWSCYCGNTLNFETNLSKCSCCSKSFTQSDNQISPCEI